MNKLFIRSIINWKMNEILDIKLVQLYSMSIIQYVNNITDIHVIHYVTC